MMGVRRVTAIACAIILGVAALSTAASPRLPVDIRVFQFKPGHLDVTAGTIVAWTNHDDITHTVTSGTPDARDGRFQQRLEGKGSTISVDFNDRGVYPYFCERHPSMRGEIRVN